MDGCGGHISTLAAAAGHAFSTEPNAENSGSASGSSPASGSFR